MAYTNNIPQGNQQIATTQPLIQANFGFIQTAVSQEHNFNSAGSGTDMYHLKASMPNQADPGSLPVGTNGQYYVNGSNAKFYDGTRGWVLNQFVAVLSGTFIINSGALVTISAVPANVVGFGICYKVGAIQPFSFFTDGTNCYAYSNRVKIFSTSDDYPIEMSNNTASLNIQGARFSASYNGTYTYKIWYRPA